MKVFLDTNILVSAIATRGLCVDVFRVVLTEHQLVISKKLLIELERVLAEKIGVPSDVIHSYLELIHQIGLLSKTSKLLNLDIKDQSDLPIISSAY
jgi:predicted nucleic acid-binding protein